MTRPLNRLVRLSRFGEFVHDRSGATAIYVGAIMAVLVGFIGITIDFGRFNTTHTQAAHAADALALAAASQLDGRPDAITRATLAVQTSPVVQNRHNLASDADPTIAVQTLRFLHGLPADTQPITASYETTDPTEARFVEVTTVDLTHDNWFIQAVGGSAGATTRGVAVAGYNQMVCRIPPLMICNPFETASSTEFPAAAVRGVQVITKTKTGGTSAWAPGDFGLLDPSGFDLDTSTNAGAKTVAELIASVSPQVCFSGTVEMRPGQVTSMENGYNVRFDLYQNPFFGSGAARSNPLYRPARNVIKGMTAAGGACKQEADPAAQKLPRDQCLETATCPTSLPARVGDGNWDRTGYWAANHGTPLPAALASASRYDVYRYEIDNDLMNPLATPENGEPQCYSGTTPPSDNPDRRVLYLAVINCLEQGPLTGASNTNIEVEAFAKTFATEPIPDDGTGTIVLEIVDVVKPGDDVLHDIVQLYR